MLKHRGANGAMGFFFKRYLQNMNRVFFGLLHCSRRYSNITLCYKTKDNQGLEGGFICTVHSRKPCSFQFTTAACRSYRSPPGKSVYRPNVWKNTYATTIKKYKTCTVFLWSHTNTSGSLGEREMHAMGTRVAGECFHSFFEFSQTFTSVCVTR